MESISSWKPTVLGVVPVLAWGAAIPITRILQAQMGALRAMGAVFAITGVLGLAEMAVNRSKFPPRSVFANPYLYARWLAFVIHEACVVAAISIVRLENVPLVILINYLWPTVTILASVLMSDVPVVRPLAVACGSGIVLASLSFELLRKADLSLEPYTRDLLAYGVALIGAVAWGLYGSVTKRAGQATGGGSVLPLFQLTLGFALPVSFTLRNAGTSFNVLSSYGLYLALFIWVQFLAYRYWDYGMRHGNLVILSLMADSIPWISLVAARLLLGVGLDSVTVVSAFALVAGAVVTRYGTTSAFGFVSWWPGRR